MVFATAWQPLPNAPFAPRRFTAQAVTISGYGGTAFLLRASGIRFAPPEMPPSRNRKPAPPMQ